MSKPLVTLTSRCISHIISKINKYYNNNIYINNYNNNSKIKEKDKMPTALRIAVDSGGCNGLSYNYSFTNQVEEGDILIKQGETNIVIDKSSSLFLKGATIDYTNEMIRSGFSITNPNAESTCGCSSSFSLKD